jgi:glycosyltransferase involved in cell wall biosynthesis
VAWTPGCGAQRALSNGERHRVLHWDQADERDGQVRSESESLPLVVPWRSTLVLAEVPPGDACTRLAALGQYSGNKVSAIGYDCVPIVSADMVPFVEPNRFARYLSVIKNAHQVAGISISATTEFAGFADALPNQGLDGPTVVECRLPAEGVRTSAPLPELSEHDPRPTVLSVGSFEPRKNHLALLYAAERLWRDGLSFRLHLIGGSGWGDDVPRRVRKLRSRYPITMERRVSNRELAAAYRAARFTVFPSLHEGYGLPVAESIAFGTPVITSNYGSTKEIGEGRGAELIDPRNDDELVAAMRRLLCDAERLAALCAETQRRTSRSWEDYAVEAWHSLVTASRAAVAADGATR